MGATDSAPVAGFSRAWPAPTVKLIGGEGHLANRNVCGVFCYHTFASLIR